MYIDRKYLIYAAVALLLIVLATVGLYACSVDRTPAIVPVQKVDIPNVKAAFDSQGFNLTNKEVGAVVDKIEDRVARYPSDFKATVPDEKTADKVIAQVAKKDKADMVIKEEKDKPGNTGQSSATGTAGTTGDSKDIYYYGIHMEKKTGIGMYADLDKEGSMGLHLRREKLIVEVGQKYVDKSITARVAYELIQR